MGDMVLWVDPYPTRFPRIRDLRRLTPTNNTGPQSHTPPWITVIKPGGLPIEPLPGSGWLNGPLWRRHLKQICEFANAGETLLAIGKPSALALAILKHLPQCRSLYDAMDDFPAFYTGLSHSAMARREIRIVRRVNNVWASSSAIKSRWDRLHSATELVHNGLDLSVIPALTVSTNASGRKILGYVGTIASWFDWEWICALANTRQNDEIRLIGPVFEPANRKLPDNISLLPPCDHATAIKAMTQFDVGLIPFKNNVLTASVDPIKYYEYRAVGLPVVSTDFGEMSMRHLEPGVFISKSLNDLPNIVESAIQFTHDADEASTFAEKNTWEARFDATRLFT